MFLIIFRPKNKRYFYGSSKTELLALRPIPTPVPAPSPSPIPVTPVIIDPKPEPTVIQPVIPAYIIDVLTIGCELAKLYNNGVVLIDGRVGEIFSYLDEGLAVEKLCPSRIVVYCGRLYALINTRIYILNPDSFNTCKWRWILILDYPKNIIDLSASLDGFSLWMSNTCAGFLQCYPCALPEKITDYPEIRRYGYTKHEYIQLCMDGTAFYFYKGRCEEKFKCVRDAIVDTDNCVHLLKTDDTRFRGVRLINWKPIFF